MTDFSFYFSPYYFQSRNYALFFGGQSISQIGTWMQRTAVSWVVYSITHSAFMLGLTVFAQQFPSFILSLYGGIISDRYSKYKILLITQTASMIQAILLAILTLSGHYVVWQILGLSILLGIINAFDVPARQPMIHEMIDNKEDLPNALALNSAMVNLARLLGPALSGIVLQKFGAGICFLSNAISFMAVLTSLLMMKLPSFTPSSVKKKALLEIHEGFQYMKQTREISIPLLLLMLASMFVLPYDTLIPIFANVVFKGDAATFGYISSFMGLGAIAGTFFLASLKKGDSLKTVIMFTGILLGIGLCFFSHISYFPLAMVFAVLIGFGAMSQNTACITIVQVHSAQHMRGRMMSYIAFAYFGTLPLGSLLIGTVSQQIGAQNTLLVQGIISLIIAAIFFPMLRRESLTEDEKTQMEEVEATVADKI
ncbi:MAG: MFS transporter [Bacteroidetes bacterium]|nr:MFS transporter [Bacteroidota bacterium]